MDSVIEKLRKHMSTDPLSQALMNSAIHEINRQRSELDRLAEEIEDANYEMREFAARSDIDG